MLELGQLYSVIGFVVFWLLVVVAFLVISSFISVKLYSRWVVFWESMSNKQWEDNNAGEELPSNNKLKKSWRYMQVAHPYKNGIKGPSWSKHKEDWDKKRQKYNSE